MKSHTRTYSPQQSYLLPPSLQDWLPEGHLSYFILDTVEQLNLKNFKVSYQEVKKTKKSSGEKRGGQGMVPYSPKLLVGVLLYAYSTGVFSSRQIVKKLHEDIAFRLLGGGHFPSYRTICRFRAENQAAFTELFSQVVKIAQECGLIKLGLVAVDGTKMRANASKHKAMSLGRMKQEEARLKAEIEELLKRAEAVDEAERGDDDDDDDDIPEEMMRREKRRETIKAAMERLKNRVPEEELTDKSQENFTDPDSRIMRSNDGYVQAYNAQLAVDEEAQIIVGAEVSQCGNDHGQLTPMVEAVQAECGEFPKSVTSDAGYRSEKSFQELERHGIRGYVALGKEGRGASVKKKDSNAATVRMAERLAGKRGKKQYAKRKAIIEPVFGWMKGALKFRQFLLRGLEKVQAEWRLLCTAINLRRMSVLREPKIAL